MRHSSFFLARPHFTQGTDDGTPSRSSAQDEVPASDGALHEVERRLLALRGNPRQAAKLLVAFVPRVRWWVRLLVKAHSQDNDDITQEVLVVVLRSLPGFRGDGPFTAWLDRTVARAAIAEARRTRSRQGRFVAVPTADDRMDESAVDSDEYLTRQRAIATLDMLPEPQRQAVILHDLLGLTVREAAQEMLLNVETFRSRLRVARARLRAEGLRLGEMPAGATQDPEDAA